MAEYPIANNGFSGFLDERLLVDEDGNVVICYGDNDPLQSTALLFLKYDSISHLIMGKRAEYTIPYCNDLLISNKKIRSLR